MAKLFITDHADPSVGLFSETHTIETPFKACEEDFELREWFRLEQVKIYREFAMGNVTAEYDFERAARRSLLQCLKAGQPHPSPPR